MPPIESRRRHAMEEPEEEQRKEEARREKKLGDDAYRGMHYKPAVEHYTRGANLDTGDISFWIKRAKAYFRMNQYEAVKRGGVRSENKLVAEALSWKGSALFNLAACAADYKPAIMALRQSLDKHHSEETQTKIDEAESMMKSFEEQEAADRHQHKENSIRKKYEESAMQFTEAIKKNPRGPKNFSDRAQCRIKQGELPKVLEDADRCIELDCTFGMGYVCKGMAQLFMGKYEDAQATYGDGLKHDPRNLEIHDGLERCAAFIKMVNDNNARAEDSRKQEKDIEYLCNELQNSKDEASHERSRRMESEELARALEDSYSGLIDQLTMKHDVATVELQLAKEHKEDLERQLSECRERLERLLSIQNRIPPHFICPISHEVMNDPHIAADGYTYEAEEIRHWFRRGRHTSPMTNLRLEHKQLIRNRALRSAIEE